MNNKVEKLIENGCIKANNEYGYMFKGEVLLEINNLGYGLKLAKEGIGYFKF